MVLKRKQKYGENILINY